jgi:DNA-binding MarR family transcriptional regulator
VQPLHRCNQRGSSGFYTAAVDHDGETPFTADSLVSALRGIERRDLTFTQFVAMHVIAGRGRPTIREVADAIDRSPAATSRLLDDLVRAGLVARASSYEDRRVKHVYVTAAAKDYLAALHKAHHDRPRRRHPH